MRIPSILKAASATVLALAGLVAHADQLSDIKKKGEIVIGVLGIDEPNSFIDPKTREFIGYEIDSLTHNKERESQVDVSLTTVVTGQKALVKKSSGIKDVPELAGKKVVTVKGGTQEPNIKKAVPTADVVTFENTQQAFQALQQGKGVAFVNDEASLIAEYAKLGDRSKDYAILPQNLSVEPLAFGIKKGETSLKTAVDDTLRGLEKSGAAEKIFLQWYGPNSSLKFPNARLRHPLSQAGLCTSTPLCLIPP